MHTKNNKLYFGKYSSTTLAKKFGTPLYVYEADVIRQRYLKLILHLGAKIETVSRGEITSALKVGFKSKDILYTSSSVTEEEMVFVIKNNIKVNLDSLSQIELYGKLNPNGKIGIRINQGIGAGHHSHVITGGVMSKFGIPLEHLSQAKKLAKKYKLQIVSLHQHIGSNVLDSKILLKAFDKLLETAKDFSELESLDFGGGLGIPYLPKDKNLNLKLLGQEMTRKMNNFSKIYGRELNMILEPGRFLVAEAGTLLANVTEIKTNPKRTFVGINTGFNHLLRPAMYGSHHEIINANKIKGAIIKVDVAGNICESGDVFGRDRKISKPKVGDVLAIKNSGAYGYVMASRYNSRELPREILIGKNGILRSI